MHHRRVVQHYYRVPGNGVPSRTGLGLGLYFCRRTILAHAGRIWIESPLADQRRGTRVLFTLPSTGPEAGA
jgi:signal transduction histidine kinase